MTGIIMAVIIILTGCTPDSGKVPHFETPQEAVNACTQWWESISSINEDCNIEQVTELTVQWMELQDSAYSCFFNDSSVINDAEISQKYYIVADSVRHKIVRMATLHPRTLKDVIFFKVHTIPNKEKLRQSKDFHEACSFFSQLDEKVEEPTATANEYLELLQTSGGFHETDDILQFLQREDVCFRSLLTHLSTIPQEQLNTISARTESVFNQLHVVLQGADKDTQQRMNVYLLTRTNRRILQNAAACRNDIEHKVVLEKQCVANYKWMLLQPFITLDDDAIAYLTEEQESELLHLAGDMDSLFTHLDGNNQMESQKLIQVLSDYILNLHMKSIL